MLVRPIFNNVIILIIFNWQPFWHEVYFQSSFNVTMQNRVLIIFLKFLQVQWTNKQNRPELGINVLMFMTSLLQQGSLFYLSAKIKFIHLSVDHFLLQKI